jgi:hypothetical protein
MKCSRQTAGKLWTHDLSTAVQNDPFEVRQTGDLPGQMICPELFKTMFSIVFRRSGEWLPQRN